MIGMLNEIELGRFLEEVYGAEFFTDAGHGKAVHQVDVEKPVAVVVDEGAAGTHGLRHVIAAGGATRVNEVYSGLSCSINEIGEVMGSVVVGTCRDQCEQDNAYEPPHRRAGLPLGQSRFSPAVDC